MGLSLYQFRLKKKFGIKLGYTTTPKKKKIILEKKHLSSFTEPWKKSYLLVLPALMRVIFAIKSGNLPCPRASGCRQSFQNRSEIRCLCSDCHLCPALVRYGHLGPIGSRVALPLPRMCLCHRFLPLQFCYLGKIRASIGTQSFPCLKLQTNTV